MDRGVWGDRLGGEQCERYGFLAGSLSSSFVG